MTKRTTWSELKESRRARGGGGGPRSEAGAVAVIDLIAGSLLTSPRRIGKPLTRELEGLWSARRGTFRNLYRIDDTRHEVIVLRVDHRKTVDRPS